ncbi:TTF-type zinc finger protein with HAT dimerisation domain [Striga hermonthica]|uniref:TTF-type zinc finger protein with HAT dimerisation domain n=1 Tax=Striga hermonthica TaxID=68872 RepID=A0A9N7RIX1_STRHE|nr:TTF-type zinc finger protein with HAT dimerisation domain [Striga hermonthica]
MDVIREKHYNDVARRIESGEISTGTGKNQETSLARPGATRWGSHYRTINRILEMWDAVQDVLDGIIEDAMDFQSRGVAKGFLDKSTSFEFVFIAHLMVKILASTSALSAALQEKTQNIGYALVLIKSVKKDLRKLREDGWEDLLMKVTTFCSEKVFLCLAWKILCRVGLVDLKKKWMINQRLIYIIFDGKSSFRDCFASFDVERLLRLAQLYPNDFDDELKLKA